VQFSPLGRNGAAIGISELARPSGFEPLDYRLGVVSILNTLLISKSKIWKTLDVAGFHRCYTVCYVWPFSANFHRFLWS